MRHLRILERPMLLGVGLYTTSEAAKLINVPGPRLRRWLAGYQYRSDGESRWSEPLWRPQLPRFEETVALGFRDLMELRFVDAFLGAGLSLRAIRLMLGRAQEAVGDTHPFSTARFRTDGQTIFLQIAKTLGEPKLFDLRKKQFAFNRMVEPSFRDLDIEDGVAARWWPLSKRRNVVVDPDRSFGQPIVASRGVPTTALAAAARVEVSERRVADRYEVSLSDVRAALAFEQRKAA